MVLLVMEEERNLQKRFDLDTNDREMTMVQQKGHVRHIAHN